MKYVDAWLKQPSTPRGICQVMDIIGIAAVCSALAFGIYTSWF